MPKLYTIGHSNRRLDEFLDILHSQGITHVIDVRTVPKSRRVPWANQDALKASLAKQKIHYKHMPELGGLRKTKADSINQGWHNASFRGYADYMQTPEFFNALKKLRAKIKKGRKIAILCAEAVPWRCHRSLIADALLIRHIQVLHITSKSKPKRHKLTSFAKINRHKRPIQLWYP